MSACPISPTVLLLPRPMHPPGAVGLPRPTRTHPYLQISRAFHPLEPTVMSGPASFMRTATSKWLLPRSWRARPRPLPHTFPSHPAAPCRCRLQHLQPCHGHRGQHHPRAAGSRATHDLGERGHGAHSRIRDALPPGRIEGLLARPHALGVPRPPWQGHPL